MKPIFKLAIPVVIFFLLVIQIHCSSVKDKHKEQVVEDTEQELEKEQELIREEQ